MPKVNIHLTPYTSLGVDLVLFFFLTHNPMQVTVETVGTLLTDSSSDVRAFFPKAFPQPSLGIIREVRKLGDFLLQTAGSECRLAEVVSAQRTLAWNPHTRTRTRAHRLGGNP